MRSIIAIYILLWMGIQNVFSQSAGITLEQALERGMANRAELKGAQIQVQLAEIQHAKIRAQWRPQVNASGDFRVNTQLQKSVIPTGAFGLPNTPSDATATVAFGVPFQNLVGVDISQKIYDANRSVDRQINDTNVKARQLDLNRLRRDIRLSITEAYCDALWQREKVRYAREALKRAETQVEYVSVRQKNGASTPNDYYRAMLDRNNAEQNATQAQRDFSLSVDYLRYQIADTSSVEYTFGENLKAIMENIEKQPITPGSKHLEVQLEENALAQNTLLERKERLRLRPEVSAYGNFSLLALNDELSPFNYFGIRATLPLYDGQQARLSADEYRLRQQINSANLEKLRNDIAYEIASTLNEMQTYYYETGVSEKNMMLAQSIYENSQNSFRQGAIVFNDLKADELALKTAENKYLENLYRMLVALLKHRKARGEQ